MKKIFIPIFFLLCSLFPFHPSKAQQIVRTSGESQVEWADYKSLIQVQQEAKDLATIDALEKAFGRVIIQGNSTYLTNLNTGEQTETRSVFNMIANTSVKGEVLEVLDENYTEVEGYKIVANNREPVREIKCEITIRAMEITAPPIEFLSFPLACTNIKCKTTRFKEDDDLFFFFRSPVNGYLSIFLDDGINAYRILPYQDMPDKYEGGIPVESDKEYILFSDAEEFDYFENEPVLVDTYELFAENEQDLNRLFVIFSREPLNKPKLSEGDSRIALSEKEIDEGYTLPLTLESEDYQRWLIKQRTFFKEKMDVDIIDIVIDKH